MKRRDFLQTGALSCALAIGKPGRGAAACVPAEPATWQPPAAFELEELTISELQQGMAKGEYTAKSLVKAYLERIAGLDKKGPTVNAVIELNPDATRLPKRWTVNAKPKAPAGRCMASPF
jgi:amidase